eukprot:g4596.t1
MQPTLQLFLREFWGGDASGVNLDKSRRGYHAAAAAYLLHKDRFPRLAKHLRKVDKMRHAWVGEFGFNSLHLAVFHGDADRVADFIGGKNWHDRQTAAELQAQEDRSFSEEIQSRLLSQWWEQKKRDEDPQLRGAAGDGAENRQRLYGGPPAAGAVIPTSEMEDAKNQMRTLQDLKRKGRRARDWAELRAQFFAGTRLEDGARAVLEKFPKEKPAENIGGEVGKTTEVADRIMATVLPLTLHDLLSSVSGMKTEQDYQQFRVEQSARVAKLLHEDHCQKRHEEQEAGETGAGASGGGQSSSPNSIYTSHS